MPAALELRPQFRPRTRPQFVGDDRRDRLGRAVIRGIDRIGLLPGPSSTITRLPARSWICTYYASRLRKPRKRAVTSFKTLGTNSRSGPRRQPEVCLRVPQTACGHLKRDLGGQKHVETCTERPTSTSSGRPYEDKPCTPASGRSFQYVGPRRVAQSGSRVTSAAMTSCRPGCWDWPRAAPANDPEARQSPSTASPRPVSAVRCSTSCGGS